MIRFGTTGMDLLYRKTKDSEILEITNKAFPKFT
jgi:hypothetical protein